MEFKIKIKIKREEGPTWNQKCGILKYISAEFSLKSQRMISVQRHASVVS